MKSKLPNRKFISFAAAVAFLLSFASVNFGQTDRLRGTLVVAVPVSEGLVTCADKRLFNIDAGTFKDDSIKIRQVGENALFVATSTVGFYDRKKKAVAFDAFKVTADYAAKNDINSGKPFFEGLRAEITDQLREYLFARPYAEWPETDKPNQGLLFNLVFYTLDYGVIHSHTLKVFYEKAPTPKITIPSRFTEIVEFPKLSGKGRDVMGYLARNPTVAAQPAILRFDESRFNPQSTTVRDAVDFSRKLFLITNMAIPQAHVSATFDCAFVSRQMGFQWIDGFGRPKYDPLRTAQHRQP